MTIQCEDYFTVASRLELIVRKFPAYVLMVIYLTVHSKHLLAIGREEGLLAALGIDYRQTFMGQYGRLAAMDAAPVRTAMTYLLTHAQGLLPQRITLFLDIEYAYYSTHGF